MPGPAGRAAAPTGTRYELERLEMGSRRYVSKADPGATTRYSLRADTRLRTAFAARALTESAEGYVPLVNDGGGPCLDWLHHTSQILELAAALQREIVVYVLASGGTMDDVAETLKISPVMAKELYGELWAERQAEHATERPYTPIKPEEEHLMLNLDDLDDWAAAHDPSSGAGQVTGALVYPHVPTAEARTRAEVQDSAKRVVRDAETTVQVAAFRADHEAAVAAAIKRLARRPGTARSSLWNDRRPPYVIVRGGALLGIADRHYLPSDDHGRPGAARWSVSHAPEPTYKEHDLRFITLEDAIQYLEHRPGAPEETA